MNARGQLTTSASPAKITGASTFPSGISEFDEATEGGFPTNRISVVYGPPDAGKTLLLCTAIAHYHQLDSLGKAVLFDLKGDYTRDWAIGPGIEPERVITLRPEHAEHAAEMLADVIAADDIGLIGVDSIASLISAEELEKSASEKVREGNGLSILRLLRSACLATAARSSGPAIICINHASGFRQHNDRHRMVGGAPLDYYASTVVRLEGGRHVWKDNVRVGMPDQKWTRGVVEKRAGVRCETRFEYPLDLPKPAHLDVHAPKRAATPGSVS